MYAKVIRKTNKQVINWKKIFAKHISNKELISKLCKELIKVDD